MSLQCGIFQSNFTGVDDNGIPQGDRAVDDIFFARYHSMVVSNGVSGKVSDSFQVVADGTLTIQIKPGDIFINGWYAYDLSSTSITITKPTSNIIYRVVAQLNLTNRNINIQAKAGTNGQKPSLTRSTDVYELCLAEITLVADQTSISQKDIKDTRLDTSLCGIITGAVNSVDTSTLLEQMDDWFSKNQAEQSTSFNTWFDGVKNTLTTDAAGNLLTKIESETTRAKSIEDSITSTLTSNNSIHQRKYADGEIDIFGRINFTAWIQNQYGCGFISNDCILKDLPGMITGDENKTPSVNVNIRSSGILMATNAEYINGTQLKFNVFSPVSLSNFPIIVDFMVRGYYK